MEEERYTIESFEIDEPSCIFDNKTQQRILSLVEYNYDEITNLKNLLNQQDAKNKKLEEENGYIIFADGYDENENEVHKQVYKTYKSKCDELKQENQQLKEKLEVQKNKSELIAENEAMKDTIAVVLAQKRNTSKNNYELRKEITQLKQSQNQKAIEELEKVKEWIKSVDESGYIFPFRDMDTREKFNQKLDNQIKELRGKNE